MYLCIMQSILFVQMCMLTLKVYCIRYSFHKYWIVKILIWFSCSRVRCQEEMMKMSSTLVETVSINYEDFNESFLTCGTCLCKWTSIFQFSLLATFSILNIHNLLSYLVALFHKSKRININCLSYRLVPFCFYYFFIFSSYFPYFVCNFVGFSVALDFHFLRFFHILAAMGFLLDLFYQISISKEQLPPCSVN